MNFRRTMLISLIVITYTPGAHAERRPAIISGDIAGTVSDSSSGKPLPGGDIRVMRGTSLIFATTTDGFGRFIAHNIPAGSYLLEARYLGYSMASRLITVSDNAAVRVDFRLAPTAISLETIEVKASVPLSVDTRSGDQVFKQNDYHGAPTNTTSQILQQSIAGAARAPTGEVHIRGQHAEYTYYVDGVPVTAGVSGSLNELFDPEVVNQIDFQTGGWDAEFGNKNAAIINVTTRIPVGPFHADGAAYAGTFNTNGQSLSLSGNAGKLGMFVSGARQVTDMRREPVVFDTSFNQIENFHNHGEDLFAFGKIQYNPSALDVINLDVNRSRTRFSVPFDSVEGIIDDRQQDLNGFVNLGWQHRFAGTRADEENSQSEIFAGLYYRDGSLRYTPGASDEPSFIFYPDSTAYNLSETRQFNTTGAKIDYTNELSHELTFKTGVLASTTRGHEDFNTIDVRGETGPESHSNLTGHDVGVYAQTQLTPSDRWELRTGVRYDSHVAPFAGDQHQVSPRVKLSYFPNAASTIYAYYGRLFVPTNVEDLRAITKVADSGAVEGATLPERDHFFEAGALHRFANGLVAKVSGYYKTSTPGIDDNTVPGSAIVTSVNIAEVRITGIEGVLELRPHGPFSGYMNLAINHAYGYGAITGGFFPLEPPSGTFDLDHDQRVSAVLNGLYSQQGFFVSATGTFGSGLTNGADPDATYGTGLFDFNRSIKVDPSFIIDASAGHTFIVGKAVLRPQIFVTNLLDHKYLLKGAFFSGASVGRPRTVQLRVNVGS